MTYLTPKQFARELQVSVRTVYYLIKAGLPHIKVSTQPRIVLEEAVEWMRLHPGASARTCPSSTTAPSADGSAST